MPLPTKDPVSFRGVPSLGGEKKMAISMTLTQKQVEAIFARQATLRDLGSSQYPLEVDFNSNKIYIGDIATPFSRIKEDGTREICQRSPTVSKPLAGISLSGNVIGKLNVHRDFDQDVADSVRRATEAEHSKRNERTIVRIDDPPVLKNSKKSKTSGASALAKKAMSNRISSAQSTSNRPTTSTPANRLTSTSNSSSPTTARSIPPSSSSKPVLPSSRSASAPSKPTASSATAVASNSAATREIDLNSRRVRLYHYLALEARTTEQVLLEFGGSNPSSEVVQEIEDALNTVARRQEQNKKKPNPGPTLWELNWPYWEQVRPYEWPDLTAEERTKMARKARLAIGHKIPPSDPLWVHFHTRVESTSTLNDKKLEFKGGMFPKEKKSGAKASGTTNGGVTKARAPAKPKTKKEEVEVEAKVRKLVNGLAADTKTKGKANTSTAAASPTTLPLGKIPKKKKEEEEEAPSSITKARASNGIVKKESTPPIIVTGTVKARRPQSDVRIKRKAADIYTDSDQDPDPDQEMEEGELVVPEPKKRRITETVDTIKPKAPVKQPEAREIPMKKSLKEKERTSVKEEIIPPRIPNTLSAPRDSVGASSSSSSRVASSTAKNVRLEKEERQRERERAREHEERELERLKEREREKRRISGKRTRRPTPSFSSDEEDESPPSKKVATSASRVSSTTATKPKVNSHPPSSKPSAPGSKPASIPSTRAPVPVPAPAPSPTLPTDKEGLRRRYRSCYARYIGVTSKFHDQIAKVEALLATDGDSVSADDDPDMMDTDQLRQLRGEHERLRDELERIRHAHSGPLDF